VAPLRGYLAHGRPEVVAAALEALVVHGEELQAELPRLLVHADARVRAAALRACGRQRAQGLRDLVEELLRSDDAAERSLAAATGLLLGSKPAWAALRAGASEHTTTLWAWALEGTDEAVSRLCGALSSPAALPAAVEALGLSGRLSAADACAGLLADEGTAAPALGALSAITGLSGAPEEVRAAWDARRKELDPKGRYLFGAPWSSDAVRRAVAFVPLGRRAPYLWELDVRTAGRMALRPDAWAKDQLRTLARHDLTRVDWTATPERLLRTA
jgi:hypothetical protein